MLAWPIGFSDWAVNVGQSIAAISAPRPAAQCITRRADMTAERTDRDSEGGDQPMSQPPIVAPEAWLAARTELLAQEKALT